MAYKDKNKQREYQRVWVSKRRSHWLAAHGPCRVCGSWLRLEVDHIKPKDKVTHKVWSWAKQRQETELGKCQVLCKKCHQNKTKRDMQTGVA